MLCTSLTESQHYVLERHLETSNIASTVPSLRERFQKTKAETTCLDSYSFWGLPDYLYYSYRFGVFMGIECR